MTSHGKAFREAFGLVGREHVAVGKLSFGFFSVNLVQLHFA